MSLSERIQQMSAEAVKRIPADVLATMQKATAKLKVSGIENKALKEGDRAPDFSLPNHKGGEVSIGALLEKGPVVISFYRGEWCPYCNLEIKALQDALPEIVDLGASLVAISPQTPPHSQATAEKNALSFDVLSDHGNRVARQFGLVFTLAEELRPIYEQFGLDLPAYNGEDSFELPIPATYVIGAEGVILKAFVDANYTARLEPDEILKVLRG